jgi:hypothetical protein
LRRLTCKCLLVACPASCSTIGTGISACPARCIRGSDTLAILAATGRAACAIARALLDDDTVSRACWGAFVARLSPCAFAVAKTRTVTRSRFATKGKCAQTEGE